LACLHRTAKGQRQGPKVAISILRQWGTRPMVWTVREGANGFCSLREPEALRLLAAQRGLCGIAPCRQPVARAVGAVVVSPALQRWEGARKHKPGAASVNVKLLLPARQGRGFSRAEDRQSAARVRISCSRSPCWPRRARAWSRPTRASIGTRHPRPGS